ncbi:MAG: hypothetical protein KY468_19280 [Armatimonadetes bacterium]|nr:hypothetical protein [Armatimonadota bacterium]
MAKALFNPSSWVSSATSPAMTYVNVSRGKISEAIASQKEYVKKHSTDAHAYAYLAALLSDYGHMDEAIEPILRAIHLKPDAAPYYCVQGVICFQLKNMQKPRKH